ncbi:MAG: diguanylate cyclase [Cohaesibacter sp.]|jgi:PleD family two-component response regulator|nr:diguanylate cyclase [Cohaesibacter sp.]
MGKQALVLTEQDFGYDVPEWASLLMDNDFDVWSHCVLLEKEPSSVELQADILLLDLLNVEDAQIGDVIEKAIALRSQHGLDAARIPLVAIAQPGVDLSEDQLAHFSDILQPPLTGDLISNRLISLMRLSTMRREAERRATTFKRFGVGLPVVPPPRDMTQQRLLFIGSGMAFLPIQSALPDDVETVAALTPAMAEDMLKEQQFDALIVELSDYNAHLIAFIEDLRRNPSYFSLPIILICHKKASQDGLAGLASGANDIVSFPFSGSFFENRIDILVREERYRQQLRKIFSEARLLMPTDEVTRLYSETFLKTHLEALPNEASKPCVSFAGIDIRFDLIGGREMSSINENGLLSRVGRLISSLMRAEDMLARLDNGRFVALFPDTDLQETRTALQRIRAIVQLSPFVEQSSQQGIKVSLDFSLHYFDSKQATMDADKILKDLFENPVTRF